MLVLLLFYSFCSSVIYVDPYRNVKKKTLTLKTQKYNFGIVEKLFKRLF